MKTRDAFLYTEETFVADFVYSIVPLLHLPPFAVDCTDARIAGRGEP